MKYLLHPKTGGRAVEQTQQGEVIGFRRAGGELDHRRGTVENLAAPVEDELVVGGDEGEGDGERGAELAGSKPSKFKPSKS